MSNILDKMMTFTNTEITNYIQIHGYFGNLMHLTKKIVYFYIRVDICEYKIHIYISNIDTNGEEKKVLTRMVCQTCINLCSLYKS